MSSRYFINGIKVIHRQSWHPKSESYTGRVHLEIYDESTQSYWRACTPTGVHAGRGMPRPKSVAVSCTQCVKVLKRLRKTGSPYVQ